MPPEVIFVFPQGVASEATKDQLMIQVLPKFLDGHVTENTTVHTKDIVRLGPHLPPQPDYNPRPPIPGPWVSACNTVHQHIL